MRQAAGRGLVAAVVGALATVSALATGAIPARAAAAPPDMARVDPSLSGGFSPVGLSPQDDEALAVAVQPDGAIVSAGITAANRYSWDPPGDFFVRRSNADGRTDTAFGTGGAVVLGSPAASDVATAVAVQGDGKLVVGGTLDNLPVVVRLTTAGKLDPTFAGGIVRLTQPGWGEVQALALQPDGKILVAGSGVTVGRLNVDGTPDRGFGDGGVVVANADTAFAPVAMGLQPDGRIVVGGTIAPPTSGGPTGVFALARYGPDGRVDSSFGTAGTVVTSFDTEYMDRGAELDALAVQPDGRIVAAGRVGIEGFPNLPPATNPNSRPPVAHLGMTQVALARYLADGRPDTGFAGMGKVITAVPGLANPNQQSTAASRSAEAAGVAKALVLGPGGSIYVAGMALQPSAQPMVLRYTAAGLLDTTFGRNGAFTVDVGARDGWVNALAIQRDGRLVVAGAARAGLNESPNFDDLLLGRVLPGSGVGSVWAWGWNGVGQVGDGTTADAHAPVRVPGLTGVVAVSAGTYHTLALRGDGTVWAWGWNVVGQLGDGTTIDRHRPVQVPGLSGVVAISAGGLHSLAVTGDGTVWAWGYNGSGQLGDGTSVTRLTPVKVKGLAHVTAVATGLVHSLALREDGTIWAWGQNAYGQLGDGTVQDRATPVMVPLGWASYDYVAVAAGGLHSLGEGALKSAFWRWDGFCQYGSNYPTGAQYLPAETSTGVLMSSGGWYHTLQLANDGRVFAAGWNGVGQLGSTRTTCQRDVVPGLADVSAVSAGALHSLALTGDRQVMAWGWNAVGQLGTGSTVDRIQPVAIPTLANIASISGGALHSVAIQA
jgi:uncharacterized delta-60 repeat protein